MGNIQDEKLIVPQVEPVVENTNADSDYLAQTRVKSNDELAWENYQAIQNGTYKFHEPLTSEQVAKDKAEFMMRELQAGKSYEQVAYEAGISDKNLMDVSPLLDPINIAVDLGTGGLTTLGKAGLKNIGSEAFKLAGKNAIEQAGYGLLANAGISVSENYTDNFVLNTVSGLTSSLVGASLVNAFKTGGVAALRSIAKNFRENNQDMASTMARVADEYTEALPLNTARQQELVNVTSGASNTSDALTSMQAINQINTSVSDALNSGSNSRELSLKLSQSVQDDLIKAQTAKTDEEKAYYLSRAFNNAFAEAFRTPEEQKAFNTVSETLNRQLGDTPLSNNIRTVAEGIDAQNARTINPESQTGLRPAEQSQDAAQGILSERPESGANADRDPGLEPTKTPGVEPGQAPAATDVQAQVAPAQEQPVSKEAQNIPLNQRIYTPRLKLDEDSLNGLKQAVMDNDFTTVQNTIEYNLNKISDGEELKQLIAKTFEQVDLTQGTRSWNEAVNIAKDYGLDNLVRTFETTKHLDSKVYGSLVAMHSIGNSVKRLANEAVVSMTPESIANAEHAIELFTQSLAMAKGMQTEVARSMSIMRRMRIGSNDLANDVVAHLEQNGGLDLFNTKMQILKNIGESGNNKELMQGIVGSAYSRTRDAMIELMYSSMLSNPSTVAPVIGVNSISGTWALVQNTFERWLASTWFGGRGVSKAEYAEFKQGLWDAFKPRSSESDINEVRPLKGLFDELGFDIREGKYAFSGLINTVVDATNIATSDAFRLAANAFKANEGIIDSATKGLDEFGKAGALSSANLGINGWVGKGLDYVFKALGIGPRSLLFSDEFIKAGTYSAQYRALAARKAVNEGLTDAALESRIQELITQPDPDLVKGAIDFARYINVQTPLQGFTGKVVSAANSEAPMVKAVLFPFLRTAVNVMKYSAERTPGISFLTESFRNDITSGDPARRALAISKLESGTMMYIAGLALITSEYYTGPGPNDPDARKLWQDAGNIPHAIKIGDKQYAINRLDMATMPIMMLSEMMHMPEAFDKTAKTGSDMYATVMGTLYHVVSDKYYLKNFTALFDALRDKSGNAMEKFITGVTNPMVPMSSLNKTITRANDNLMRDAWGWWENLKAQTPFNDVPARRTILGEPVYYDAGKMKESDWNGLFSYDGAFTLFSPVASKTQLNDSVYNEMIRLADKGFFNRQAIKDKITFNGEVFKLEHDQHSELMDILRFNKLLEGKTAKQHIEQVISSDAYNLLPSDMLKGELLNHEVKAMHDIAIYKFASSHPEMLGLSVTQKTDVMNQKLGLTDKKPVKRIDLSILKD